MDGQVGAAEQGVRTEGRGSIVEDHADQGRGQEGHDLAVRSGGSHESSGDEGGSKEQEPEVAGQHRPTVNVARGVAQRVEHPEAGQRGQQGQGHKGRSGEEL